MTRASCFLGTRAAVLHAMWRARHVASCAAAAWVGSRAAASNHPALKHGTPISHRTRYDENYVVHFDQRTRDPLWVVERLTKQRLDAEAEHPPGRRDARYLEAADVPVRLRSRLAHYKHSGFDRGHLAPAADHRGSRDAVQCRTRRPRSRRWRLGEKRQPTRHRATSRAGRPSTSTTWRRRTAC